MTTPSPTSLTRAASRPAGASAAAVATSIALQLAVLYMPLNRYFGTVPLDAGDWGLIAAEVVVCLPAYLAVAVLVGRLEP
ncbi:hypothetical protein Htur_4271 (plasmid) [Haloterrigena turkmenica DSM 5511]|uniref:Cation-transporting P-type ATPase C-terminal domain-containing protein n=1 Tax=Haloterrigena turkmenica (strain ATCC 51198 / DSM 5511 / JCM 9101 / NCIMB 13204 / VKM B-1734 / 4k) TaxID=543526 RepID=D2S143_HALTV|nr:hypothetical protein Htur_4271 [Haloterrigena turkmenica DSM 5511]